MSATRASPLMMIMFSSFSVVEAFEKLAEPVTTTGSGPSGSLSKNLS